jgi:hypothetical protein
MPFIVAIYKSKFFFFFKKYVFHYFVVFAK